MAALEAASQGRDGAVSVHLHLPSCRRRCVFCDCHSVTAGRNPAERYAQYGTCLVQDLDLWCQRTAMARPAVTTVHFGGGIHGISLYRLNLSSRNRALLRVEGELPFAALASCPLPEWGRCLLTHLLAGWLPAVVFRQDAARGLRERWLDAGLLNAANDGFRLTANGAWLLGSMVRELHDRSGVS